MPGTGTPRLPGTHGVVTGFVRTGAGQPVAGCGLLPRAVSPIAAALKEILHLTSSDGSYQLALPAGTYTIGALTDSPSGGSLSGEVTDVIVTAGRQTRADITVTGQPPDPAQPPRRRLFRRR